jgi:hypothetical protein
MLNPTMPFRKTARRLDRASRAALMQIAPSHTISSILCVLPYGVSCTLHGLMVSGEQVRIPWAFGVRFIRRTAVTSMDVGFVADLVVGMAACRRVITSNEITRWA